MKEKRKAMYGTLEFISNVPYYGIFLIKPGVSGTLLISSVFMLTDCSNIDKTI